MYKNLAATLVAACFFLTGAQAQSPSKVTAPIKAGFVYVSPITEAGWTRQHDEGRKAVERALGDQVKTTLPRPMWPRPTPVITKAAIWRASPPGA